MSYSAIELSWLGADTKTARRKLAHSLRHVCTPVNDGQSKRKRIVHPAIVARRGSERAMRGSGPPSHSQVLEQQNQVRF